MTPEEIPDTDDVSRHLFAPSMGEADSELLWHNVFMFRTKRNFCESVVWRKYAPAIAEVHDLGCCKQEKDRRDGKDCTYFGALTANVSSVRAIRGKHGARFLIAHEPSEGPHHAHICFESGGRLTPNEKTELKKYIKDCFNEQSDHSCPEGAG